jgi:hypothetical protein
MPSSRLPKLTERVKPKNFLLRSKRKEFLDHLSPSPRLHKIGERKRKLLQQSRTEPSVYQAEERGLDRR